MSVAADEVRARLAAIDAPDGRPLTASAALSDIVVTDGKVFFSLTVGAGQAEAWEPVRQAAEAAAKSMPGVTEAFVALTAERPSGGAPATGKPAPQAAAAARARRHSGRDPHHRRRLRQGRRRQVDHRGQSGAGPRGPWPCCRPARRRHLRPLDAQAARHPRPARHRHRAHAAPARRLWPQGDVDRLPGRRGHPDDLARADGDERHHPDAARGGVGHARLPGGGHAARHRRRPAHHRPAGAAGRRGDRVDAAGPRLDRRPPRHRHVRAGRRARASASSRT